MGREWLFLVMENPARFNAEVGSFIVQHDLLLGLCRRAERSDASGTHNACESYDATTNMFRYHGGIPWCFLLAEELNEETCAGIG